LPNQVITQVAAEQYDGIAFTNTDRNILSEQFMEDTDDENSRETLTKYHNQQSTALRRGAY